MRGFLTILFLIPILTFGQIIPKSEVKSMVISSSLTFASGLCDGTAEYLKFHYSGNNQFWNHSLSWKNKYKNGDPAQGERFWQSSRAFVCVTDGYHLMRTGRNLFAMSSVVFHFGKPQKWYNYVIEIVTNYLSYTVGFTVTYELLKLRR